MPVPTRSTAEQQLDQWNDQLRASPLWQQWMQSRGKLRPGAGLSDREQKQLEQHLAQNGIKIPGGMHIDQGGNLNQKNRLWRNIGIGAAIGGATATGLGAFGVGPLAGVFGPAAAGGMIPSSAIPGAMGTIGGPAAISSMGVSSGIPVAAAATLAGRSIPAAMGSIGGPAAIRSGRASQGIPWAGAADAAEDYLGGRDPRGRNAGNYLREGANQLSPLLQSAIAALSGLPALLANKGPSDEEKALMEEARQMQAMQRQRIERQNPLFDAVTQLAMSRLPGSVQRG